MTESLADAKSIAVDLLMDYNGRFASAQIYSKSAWENYRTPSYEIGNASQYSKARDNALRGFNFMCRNMMTNAISYIQPDGEPSKVRGTGISYVYGYGWK